MAGMENGDNHGHGHGDSYSVREAERILKRADRPLTERRLRQLLQAGEIQGFRDEANRWHVLAYEVTRLLQERREPPRPAATPEASQSDDVGSQRADRLLEVIRDLERQLGRAEARAELTERAESSIQEERDRLLEELQQERAERRQLQQQLEQERISWWKRIFR